MSPFLFAIPCLIISFMIISIYWTENHGDTQTPILQLYSQGNKCRPYDMLCYKLTILGVKIILSDSNIMKLGIIQSTIESSMFIFVFVWTPILTSVSDADYLRNVHLLSYTYFVGSEWNSTWFDILHIYDLYNAGVILVQEPNNQWQQDSRWHSSESKQTLPLLSHHCWPLCRSEWGLSFPEAVVFHSFHHSWNVSWDVFPSYGHSQK